MKKLVIASLLLLVFLPGFSQTRYNSLYNRWEVKACPSCTTWLPWFNITAVNGKLGDVKLNADDIPGTSGRVWATPAQLSKLDQLTNFSGKYADLDGKPTPFSGNYNDLLNKPVIPAPFSGNYLDLANRPSLFSGNYNDLTNKPVIPAPFSGAYDDLSGKPSLFSGSYNDLLNKPVIPAPFSGNYLDLANRPSLFSGNYNDLTNKPVIPAPFSGSYLDLVNRPSLFSGNYNDLVNKPAIPVVPGWVPSTNPNYQTKDQLDAGLSQKQESGTSAYIRSINSSGIASVNISSEGGRNGTFVYDPMDTTTPDDSALTLVAQGGRRYKRVVSFGIYYPAWWGAKGDNVTDDVVAINKAIAKAPSGSVVMIDARTAIGGPIKLKRGITLKGTGTFDDGGRAVITRLAGTNAPMIQTPQAVLGGNNSTHYIALENLELNANGHLQTIETTTVQFHGLFIGSYIRNVMIASSYGPGITFADGSDIEVDHLWVIGGTTTGYALELNPGLASGGGGLMNFDHLYVENTSNKRNGDPRNVEADRGKAIHLVRGVNVTMGDVHVEGCAYGVSIESCQAVKIASLHGASVGNASLPDAALLSFVDGKIGAVNVGTFNVQNYSSNFYWVKKRDGINSNYLPDAKQNPAVTAYPGYIAINDPASGFFKMPQMDVANTFRVEKVGNADASRIQLLNGDSYGYVKQAGEKTIIGSNLFQSGGAEKDYITISSTGNNGENIALKAPLYLANRGDAGYLGANALFTVNNVPAISFGSNLYQPLSTISSGSGAPSSTPGWIGQLYVDTQNQHLYVSKGISSSLNWSNQNNYATLINQPTIPTQTSQLTNNSGFITTSISGTTTNGTNLVNITQSGTGRAMFMSRSTDNAARPLVNLVQNTAANGQPNLVIQQQDPTQKALVINNDGGSTNNLFSVDGQGNFTAVTGAVGSSLTVGGKPVVGYLTGSVTYNPGTIATGSQQSTPISVTGATLGQFTRASFSNTLQGVHVWAEVTAANTVTVYFRNDTGASVTLASGTVSTRVD